MHLVQNVISKNGRLLKMKNMKYYISNFNLSDLLLLNFKANHMINLLY